MREGRLITFEGIDGCGKSTQSEKAADFLRSKRVDVVLTREPGGTKLAERIRSILLENSNYSISYIAELMLYLASRAQHMQEIISPALSCGKWVVSDRFYDSSIAYQGFARGLPPEKVREFSLFVTKGIKPNVTFFIDVTPEIACERISNNGKSLDRLESESVGFFKRIREGYKWLAESEPNRIVEIDGSETIEKVWAQIETVLLDRFPELER
jgi:dTMP kinase